MKGFHLARVWFRGTAGLRLLGVPAITVALTACAPPGSGADEGTKAAPSASAQGGISAAAANPQERFPPPGEAWVIFGSDTVQAELARTPDERQQGLMYRQTLDSGRGMLFVFSDSQTRGFWMANTFIPLDIAYLDENLRIVDIQAMEPETTDPYDSAKPAMFALEVPQGWFAEKGIGVGAEAKVVFGPG